jgi:hypothetical protein
MITDDHINDTDQQISSTLAVLVPQGMIMDPCSFGTVQWLASCAISSYSSAILPKIRFAFGSGTRSSKARTSRALSRQCLGSWRGVIRMTPEQRSGDDVVPGQVRLESQLGHSRLPQAPQGYGACPLCLQLRSAR